jgi:hypothetical protein
MGVFGLTIKSSGSAIVGGFEGLDLAGVQWQEITTSTRAISPDSILQFDHTQFHVASQSCPGTFYSVDLNLSMCDCQDFPRIWFCKHIAVIHLHFPHLCFEESDPIIPSENSLAPDVTLRWALWLDLSK